MAHSKPYVRKKAVLAMYKLFVAYPQGLRLTFDKLRDKLNDAEATVQTNCTRLFFCLLSSRLRMFYAFVYAFVGSNPICAMFVHAPRA